MQASGSVAVLLGTYNGARFLDAQLESLARQTVPLVDIWASDDGSTDTTRALLEDWARRWTKGEFHVFDGPRLGFCENFASLLRNNDIRAEYFAFCDQDDIWAPDKLARAIAWIGSAGTGARVHAGRTHLMGPAGEALGLSPLFRHPPTFRNALVQSIAGGNTMVFNGPARDLLAETARQTCFVSHDWWTYIVVTGVGGQFQYDPRPAVCYRQHDTNAIGSNSGWRARAGRLHRGLAGRFKAWNDVNIAALNACRDLLIPEASATLEAFETARSAPPPLSLHHLSRSGVFRQTREGQIALYLACLFGRI